MTPVSAADMVDIHVPSSHTPSQLPQRLLFKPHKVLPHRKDVLSIDDELADVHVVGSAPTLPLTPPGHRNGPVETHFSHDNLLLSIQSPLGIVTPTHPRSPPTPDITPPRNNAVIKRPALSQPLQSSLSSGAASFQTARETFSSDDELERLGETPRSYSSQSAVVAGKTDGTLRSTFPKHGTSAELDRSLASQGFVSAHQVTGSDPREEGVEARPDRIPYAEGDGAATPTRESHTSHSSTDVASPTHSSVVTVKEISKEHNVPVKRENSLRDRVEDARRLESSASIEKFRADIGWPSEQERPTAAESPQSRRISMASTSTVEAMIIEPPPRAPRTLRHTEKRSSLRSVSSPVTRSEQTRAMSQARPQSQHRLTHKVARITDQDRRSIASDVSIRTSAVSSASQAHVEVIPVVVIPQRRSSLKSSNQTSSAPSQSGSRQSSSRRNTGVPGNRSASLKIRNRRPHVTPDSLAAHTGEAAGNARQPIGSVGRGSDPCLSAPLSKNGSRTTSLTEESLRQHTQAMALEQQKRPDPLPEANRHPLPVRVGFDDAMHLRPPSLPFTQTSIQSSSPGPIEINEATAVSLFPHNNRSLLLVDQKVSPESRAVRAVRLGYRHELDDLTSADASPRKRDSLDVESPLRHPRAPPKPPVFRASAKLSVAPAEEDLRDRGRLAGPPEASNNSTVRRFATVRRALSGGGPTTLPRRRTESFTSFARSLSLRSVKNRKSTQQVDGKLDSFWRPRGFWNDIAEPEDEQGTAVGFGAPSGNNHNVKDQTESPDSFINNSLGMPQQRAIIPGPPGFARHSPDLLAFVNHHRHGSSRSNLADIITRAHTPMRSPLHAHNNARVLSSSRWRVQLGSYKFAIAFADLRRRLRRARLQRAEARRAARRERIKRSIGEVVLVE